MSNAPVIVVREESPPVVVTQSVETPVVVVPLGLRGPQGETGPVGPAGPQGADAAFTYEQSVAASVWTVDHPLAKHPSVTVVDSAGTVVTGKVTFVSDARVVVEFLHPFSGFAYLN